MGFAATGLEVDGFEVREESGYGTGNGGYVCYVNTLRMDYVVIGSL